MKVNKFLPRITVRAWQTQAAGAGRTTRDQYVLNLKIGTAVILGGLGFGAWCLSSPSQQVTQVAEVPAAIEQVAEAPAPVPAPAPAPVDVSNKSIAQLAQMAEEIKEKMAKGQPVDVRLSSAVKTELQERVARREQLGDLSDTNNRNAHSMEAQSLMTDREAASFYAGNPSICTGEFKQYYKTVCKKVFGTYSF